METQPQSIPTAVPVVQAKAVAMKVILHYEDIEDMDLWKSLKITLPKSWKNGPTQKLLSQFVETYNSQAEYGGKNPLDETTMHLEVKKHDGEKSNWVPLASDAVVLDCIPDRADVYIKTGPARTLKDVEDEQQAERAKKQAELKNTVQCTHFGCRKRFPPGGPYPECVYHKSPPVFHETAKFWSCCPNKKAFDWEDFQNIEGCQTGTCSDVKDEQKLFLGGSDLREKAGEAKLKSIEDFNKSEEAGGAEAAPVLDRLRVVLEELGVEKELYNQVVEGMKKELASQFADEAQLLEAVKVELGGKLKGAMKTIAADQLRIA